MNILPLQKGIYIIVSMFSGQVNKNSSAGLSSFGSAETTVADSSTRWALPFLREIKTFVNSLEVEQFLYTRVYVILYMYMWFH